MRNIILISFIVFSFFSCTVHETDDMNMLFYGNRDSVKISVDYALLPVVTKAPAVNEFLMENVNLYVINELGDLVYYSYATERSEIEICVYENMKYSVYALAYRKHTVLKITFTVYFYHIPCKLCPLVL